MKELLCEPEAVRQAREAKRGWHWALELVVFAALFLGASIVQSLLLAPLQLVTLMQDSDYLDAVASGDAGRIAEASVSALSAGNQDMFLIGSLFTDIVLILVIFLFCRFAQKRSLRTLGFVKKGCGAEYVKGIAAGFVMFSAAVGICMLTGSLTLRRLPGTFALSVFLLFAAGYMIQGMAEEVLCRGYFMVSLGRRYSMLTAVLLNSAVFAALHLFNAGIAPLAFANLMLFGIFASLCFIRTENIWLVGALHSVWNLVQGNVYGIKVSGMETSCTVFSASMTEGKELFHGGAFGLEGGLAVTIVLVVGIAVLYFWGRQEKQPCLHQESDAGKAS